MAQIIDGKAISAQIKDELKQKVSDMKAQGKEITLADTGGNGSRVHGLCGQ